MKYKNRLLSKIIYFLALISIVSCGGGSDSTPSIQQPNLGPTADASEDQIVAFGSKVTLDASGSYDPDGDPLTYNWEILIRPVGSTTTLNQPDTVTPTFVPDIDGGYLIKLTVTDIHGVSMATFVTITTTRMSDSGQTSSYTDTFGEDSNYLIIPPAYSDNEDYTVTDNVTGLMWQQYESATIYNWYEAAGVADTTYNPGGAADVCGTLTLEGYSDWRLPNVKELNTIVNYEVHNPAIDTIVFPGALSAITWASTDSPIHTNFAWVLTFYDGHTTLINKNSSSRVRCVRGEELSLGEFASYSDYIATDHVTALTWQRTENPAMDWESALVYCEGLILAGYGDWRLPNIKELKSITDEGKENPSADIFFFPSVETSNYWSSTTNSIENSSAWFVNFSTGITRNNSDKLDSLYVRCVR